MAAQDREPYVGPRPFGRADADVFFGRDREAADLASLILAHRALLLYAPSGAGKSSLLNARVLPDLAQPERGAFVIGPARVSGSSSDHVSPDSISNVFVFHTLLSLGFDADEARAGQLVDGVERLVREHALASDAPAVLVLDQFEEVFTRHADRWKDREPFFQALGAASERLACLRIVLSMREEYVAQLVPLARHLPDRIRGRYRLDRLREDAAIEAIRRPLERTAHSFAPGVAEALAHNLLRVPVKSGDVTKEIEGEFIEPVHLQVVCQNLWRKLPEGQKQIDETSIRVAGNVDEALAGYYESCLGELVRDFKVPESRLRRWFEQTLITSEGTRSIVHKSPDTIAGLPTAVVERAEALHLVRAEVRGGSTFYELTHDRFLQPIRRSNRAWRERDAVANPELAAAEARAQSWIDGGRVPPVTGLRTFAQDPRRLNKHLKASTRYLTEATRLVRSADGGNLEVSDALREYVVAHRDAYRSATIQIFIVYLAVLFVGVIVLIGVVTYVNAKRNDAEDALQIERGRLAGELAQQRGRELDALAQGLRAVVPALKDGDTPPDAAVTGLRLAADAVLRRMPLYARRGVATEAVLSASGRTVLAWNARSLFGIDAPKGSLLFEHEAPADGEWFDGALDARGDRAIAVIRRGNEAGSSIAQSPRIEPSRTGHLALVGVDTRTGEVLETIEPTEPDATVTLALDPDHARVAVARRGGVEIVRFGADRVLADIAGTPATAALFSPDGERLVVLHELGATLLIARNGEEVRSIEVDFPVPARSRVYACAFSHDSRRFAFLVPQGSGGALVAVVDANDGGATVRAELAAGYSERAWIAFAADDAEVLVVRAPPGENQRALHAVVVDSRTGTVVRTANFEGDVRGSTHDSTRFFTVAASSHGFPVELWDPLRSSSTPLDLTLESAFDRVSSDAAIETLMVLPQVGIPELRWPLREPERQLSLDQLVELAATRLRGRAEYADLLAEIDAARR